jgi:hypothetical protein
MHSTVRGRQLALEWTDRIKWHELPAAARAELQVLLRELLRRGAQAEEPVEGGDRE